MQSPAGRFSKSCGARVIRAVAWKLHTVCRISRRIQQSLFPPYFASMLLGA